MDHIVVTIVACLVSCEPMTVRVWDGDTAWFGSEKIRLTGYDAPERAPRARCANEAAKAEEARARLVSLLTAGTRVEIGRRVGRSYDRGLAEVVVDGRPVGEILIAEGLATKRMAKADLWCR